MYKALGRKGDVPTERASEILAEITSRLSQALNGRITPTVTYNQLGAPQLAGSPPDSNWDQPLSFLYQSARMFRHEQSDGYFSRGFASMAFTQDAFGEACDVFGDVIRKTKQADRARIELEQIERIMNSKNPSRKRCEELLKIVTGKPPQNSH
jgi:hypothetical protein